MVIGGGITQLLISLVAHPSLCTLSCAPTSSLPLIGADQPKGDLKRGYRAWAVDSPWPSRKLYLNQLIGCSGGGLYAMI